MHRPEALIVELFYITFCWGAGKTGLCCPKGLDQHVASDVTIFLKPTLASVTHGTWCLTSDALD